MMPFEQKHLNYISDILDINIQGSEFDLAESEFKNTQLIELEHTFFNLPDLTISVLFEQYEGIIDVSIKGKGEIFNKITNYLYAEYINSGGAPYAQEKPKLN